jgi:hypothetical protein
MLPGLPVLIDLLGSTSIIHGIQKPGSINYLPGPIRIEERAYAQPRSCMALTTRSMATM